LAAARWRWRRVLLAVAAGLIAAPIAAGCALTCRPAWYQPASIDYTRLKVDKQDLVNLLDRIGAALNRGEPIELELSEEQVNRWITARAEIWPDSEPKALEALRHPQIILADGNRLRAGATVRWAGLEPVVSCTCRFVLNEEWLTIRCDSLSVGMLPVPRGWLAERAGKLADSLDSSECTVINGGFAFPNEWVWPNGKRRFRIQRMEISTGYATLRLEPTGPGR
jgi:hypothetical protein